MMNVRETISRCLASRTYVLLDPGDNSATLSKGLWKRLYREARDKYASPKVFAFREGGHFAFALNPESLEGEETQTAEIQYCPKHKTVGFETLNPSVGLILYEYGLPHDKAVRLSVTRKRAGGLKYYRIERPRLWKR